MSSQPHKTIMLLLFLLSLCVVYSSTITVELYKVRNDANIILLCDATTEIYSSSLPSNITQYCIINTIPSYNGFTLHSVMITNFSISKEMELNTSPVELNVMLTDLGFFTTVGGQVTIISPTKKFLIELIISSSISITVSIITGFVLWCFLL